MPSPKDIAETFGAYFKELYADLDSIYIQGMNIKISFQKYISHH